MPFRLERDLSDSDFLPESEFPQSPFRIEDFNPKSVKTGEIVGKVYGFNFKQIIS